MRAPVKERDLKCRLLCLVLLAVVLSPLVFPELDVSSSLPVPPRQGKILVSNRGAGKGTIFISAFSKYGGMTPNFTSDNYTLQLITPRRIFIFDDLLPCSSLSNADNNQVTHFPLKCMAGAHTITLPYIVNCSIIFLVLVLAITALMYLNPPNNKYFPSESLSTINTLPSRSKLFLLFLFYLFSFCALLS